MYCSNILTQAVQEKQEQHSSWANIVSSHIRYFAAELGNTLLSCFAMQVQRTLLAIKPLLVSPPKPPSLQCIGNDWTLALNLLTPWGSVSVMTSLLVSAAQQETLVASPSSCSEKVLLPFFFFLPSLPLQSSGLRPSFRSGLGSQLVLAQAPTAAASSPGQPVTSLLLCCGGDARNMSFVIFFFVLLFFYLLEKWLRREYSYVAMACSTERVTGHSWAAKTRMVRWWFTLGRPYHYLNVEDTLSGGHWGILEYGPNSAV